MGESTKGSVKSPLLLSTDTLSWYWLDLIFQIAKEQNFQGIDLAMRKNFDAWSIEYVKKLIDKYDVSVDVIQTSNRVNIKEMNQAVNLAKEVDAEVITINSPEIFNVKSYRFLKNHLPKYKAHNKSIKFAIINPDDNNYFWIVPKFYFKNMVQIIKKYSMYLWLDIANVDEDTLENQFLRKMGNFIPYLGAVYISDVDKRWNRHLPLWEGSLKLALLLKKFKQFEYNGHFSLKLDLDKKTLADLQKVELVLKKCKVFFNENYVNKELG